MLFYGQTLQIQFLVGIEPNAHNVFKKNKNLRISDNIKNLKNVHEFGLNIISKILFFNKLI